MARPEGFAWHKCLRSNRDDSGALSLPKSTCCRTLRRFATFTGSHPLDDKIKTDQTVGLNFVARPEGFEPSTF